MEGRGEERGGGADHPEGSGGQRVSVEGLARERALPWDGDVSKGQRPEGKGGEERRARSWPAAGGGDAPWRGPRCGGRAGIS